jgi:hypothetical protein
MPVTTTVSDVVKLSSSKDLSRDPSMVPMPQPEHHMCGRIPPFKYLTPVA